MASRKRPFPLTDLTGGLSVAKDPLLIADRESPNILCARMDMGLVKKDMGWSALGMPLLGVPMLITTYYKSDGVYRTLCFTTTSAYRFDTTIDDWVDITEGTEVEDCEDAWTAGAVTITAAADDTWFKKGSKSAKFTIAAGFATGLVGYEDFAGKDLRGYDHIHLVVKSSIDLAAGALQLLLDDTSACASAIETINFPALEAGVATRVSLALATPASLAAVISVGLNATVDFGEAVINLDDIRAVVESTGDVYNTYSHTTFMDTFVVTNYADPIKKYTASPDSMVELGGSPPLAKSITSFMNRLVVCYTYSGATEYPYKLQWSDPGTIETWDAANYLQASDSVDACTALITLGNKCVLFKERSIYDVAYIGSSVVFQLMARINEVGTYSPATISRVRENLAFFSFNGIYIYDQSQVMSLTDKVHPMLFRTGVKTLNLAAAPVFNSFYSESTQDYWISFCENSSSTPSLLLKINFPTQSFVKRLDKPITCIGYLEKVAATLTWATVTGTWAEMEGSWGKKGLPADTATVLLGYSTGQIYEDDAFTTTTDQFVFETKDFMYGRTTRVVECRVAARYGGYTLYYSTDGGKTWVQGTTFASTLDWTEHVYYMNLTTQQVRFKITTSEPSLEIRWIEPWNVERLRSKEVVSS